MNEVDNLDQQTADNPDLQQETSTQEVVGFSWKDKLGTDLKGSPSLQKFDDSPEGLSKAMESYHNLEKLLGHEKVPIPKGPEDKDGWARFSKAMGIPYKAENYGLADADLPESMKGLTFDKQKFAEIVHAHKLTPGPAKGLWKAYTDMSLESYGNALKDHEQAMTQTINQLRSEWGDTYEANIDLTQLVISKFAPDKETEDYLTATLTKDPKAIKFLAKIGSQFAENKIGEFSYQNFSLSPEQAEAEAHAMMSDIKGPYHNNNDETRRVAIDRVNSLLAISQKAKRG